MAVDNKVNHGGFTPILIYGHGEIKPRNLPPDLVINTAGNPADGDQPPADDGFGTPRKGDPSDN